MNASVCRAQMKRRCVVPVLVRHFTLGLVMLAVGIGCTGCSKQFGIDVVPVTGVVTLDGVPVDGATVLFSPVSGGRSGFARTNEAGRFIGQTALGSRNVSGLVPGDYKVAVKKIIDDNPPPPPEPVPPVPGPDGSVSQAAVQEYQALLAAYRAPRPQKPFRHLVPEVYDSPSSSPLAAAIGPGGASLQLQLVSNDTSGVDSARGKSPNIDQR